jgi:hypothetical protein
MQPDIKVVTDYVQEGVGEDEFDRNVRVSSRELGDQRCEATSTYFQRRADAQMPVCTENLSSGVVVVKPAKDGV